MINQKIENAFEEGHTSQTAMDYFALEYEKEKLDHEFQEQNEESQKKFNLIYSAI